MEQTINKSVFCSVRLVGGVYIYIYIYVFLSCFPETQMNEEIRLGQEEFLVGQEESLVGKEESLLAKESHRVGGQKNSSQVMNICKNNDLAMNNLI